MCISIPPKFSERRGLYQRQEDRRNFLGRRRNFTGESFWARGYFVSTVGLDEVVVREYIRNQEKEDRRLDFEQGAGLGLAKFGFCEGLTEDQPTALPGVNV